MLSKPSLFQFQVSSKLGLVFVITKYGALHLCDLESCTTLCSVILCPDIVFSTAWNGENEGIVAISRNGQVCSFCTICNSDFHSVSIFILNWTVAGDLSFLLPTLIIFHKPIFEFKKMK